MSTALLDSLGAEGREALAAIVGAYAARRPGWDGLQGTCRILEAEYLRAGRPAVLDVVAELAGVVVHVPIGLRAAGEEPHLLPEAEGPALGRFADEDGEAVAFDALADAETAALLLEVVAGEKADVGHVRLLRMDHAATTLGMDDRVALTVFNALVHGPRPSTEIVVALDHIGFNHLAAPIALWRRGDWDLGIVQEHLVGGSTGSALALTSVRDLYASGGPPELAGGDFGAEAHRLGTMTARLHLALAEAFGRRPASPARWADAVEAALLARQPLLVERPDVASVLGDLRRLPEAGDAIRTHGDFHLGRVWRTEQGWYVADFSPGGAPPPGDDGAAPPVLVDDGIVFRSPLADVADMLWSFGHVASSAAAERDPTGREGLRDLAEAWEQRNRRSFLAGYLAGPGLGALVPTSRDAVRALVAALELERATRGTS
ncbi:MAG: hypothetical protein ACYDA2_04450 [Acidimicrobiales bacterium]